MADLDAIVAMGQRFRQSTGYQALIPENLPQMRHLAAALIDRPGGVVLVADRAGTLCGLLGLLVYPHYLSGEMVGGELFWWVNPEARGIGLRLLRHAEMFARAHGAAAIQMIAPTPEVEALYTRLGYQPVERLYQRRLA